MHLRLWAVYTDIIKSNAFYGWTAFIGSMEKSCRAESDTMLNFWKSAFGEVMEKEGFGPVGPDIWNPTQWSGVPYYGIINNK